MNFAHPAAPLSSLKSIGASIGVLVLAACAVSAAPLAQREGAELEHLNLSESGLALDGFDPVAYFSGSGGVAVEGNKKYLVTIRGVTYRFQSKKNRELFLGDPEKYEPAYGGWCAFAMAKGEKVEVDPESFLVEKGRLFVFYNGLFANTRKSWLKKGEGKLEPIATKAWDGILGRKPMIRSRAKEAKLALEGTDPTTAQSGSEAKPGLPTITTRIGDFEYRFANHGNREAFVEDPERYLASKDGKSSPSGTL